jgi:hypothetical protein
MDRQLLYDLHCYDHHPNDIRALECGRVGLTVGPFRPHLSKLDRGLYSDVRYCRGSHLKRNPHYNSICKVWWHQYNRQAGCFNVPSTLRIVSLVNIVWRRTSFSRNDFLCPDILYTNRCVVLFGTSLYAKDCSVMKACSTLEYTMCTHKQFLSSWREYGPSN